MANKLTQSQLDSLCQLFPCKDEQSLSQAVCILQSLTACDYYGALQELHLSIKIEPSGDGEVFSQLEVTCRALSVLAILVNVQSESLTLPKFFQPLVHSHSHALTLHLPLVNFMLQSPDTAEYAVSIIERLLDRVGEGTLQPDYYDILRECPIHHSLVKVMQFAPDAKLRSQAVKCFRRILHAFNPNGRLLMINITLRQPGQASGLQELVLNEYRSLALKEESLNESQFVFRSKKSIQSLLRTLIPLCTTHEDSCESPPCEGKNEPSKSDILAKNELILGTLNFIRFFLLRDPQEVNSTGIWNLVDLIYTKLITPLNSAIEEAKTNLLSELNNLSKESAESKRAKLDYVSKMQLEIPNGPGEENTSKLPEDFDEQGLKGSIVKLDLMSSVTSRLTELLHLHPFCQSTVSCALNLQNEESVNREDISSEGSLMPK